VDGVVGGCVLEEAEIRVKGRVGLVEDLVGESGGRGEGGGVFVEIEGVVEMRNGCLLYVDLFIHVYAFAVIFEVEVV
ncbi:hypothetical protein, partial [Paenibacillus sp. Y412MC10]|uniref:hypothetical protein n=1 Tax=Geobacillus sp. (strain Y412MC10) TaxID=481743 RepID=UPI001C93156B